MSKPKPYKFFGEEVDEARILCSAVCSPEHAYQLSVFDVTSSGTDYEWRHVAYFPSWLAARNYCKAEFPLALLAYPAGSPYTPLDDDDEDDDDLDYLAEHDWGDTD